MAQRPTDEEVAEFRAQMRGGFAPYFEACETLDAFLAEHLPTAFVRREDRAEALITATFARGLKTYRAILALCADGWGEQAAMLNRSLFEDMVVAYWVEKVGEAAVVRLLEHHELSVDVHREALLKHDGPQGAAGLPVLDSQRREELEETHGKYAERPWYGSNLHSMIGEIESYWTDEDERRLLWRMYGVGHRFNNLVLHHTSNALNQTARYSRPEEDTFVFSVGRGSANVHGALQGAFYALSQLGLLVLTDEPREELLALISRELPRFELDPSAGVRADVSETPKTPA